MLMSPMQAVQILDRAAASAKMSRQEHLDALLAVDTLKETFKPQEFEPGDDRNVTPA